MSTDAPQAGGMSFARDYTPSEKQHVAVFFSLFWQVNAVNSAENVLGAFSAPKAARASSQSRWVHAAATAAQRCLILHRDAMTDFKHDIFQEHMNIIRDLAASIFLVFE